jgi:hypothetical protein
VTAAGSPIATPYRAIFCDLLTDRTIDVLPLTQVSFDDYIGKPGSLDGTVPLPNSALAARARRMQEGRTAVYVERDGELWWGGIIWTRTLQSDDQGVLTLGLQAATFDSYAGRRIIRPLPQLGKKTLEFDNADQFDIVRGLWDYMKQTPGGDVLVSYDTGESGVLTSAVWNDGDETVVSDAIDQLAGTDTGFEYHVVVYRDPDTGQRVRRLQFGRVDPADTSPTAKVAKIRADGADLLFDQPGGILTYSLPYDGTRGGTAARARGADISSDSSTESGPIISGEVVATDLITGGYPRVDLSSDHGTVTDPNLLGPLATAELAVARGSVMIPDITVRLDDLVPPEMLGRTARVRIRDAWFAEGLDARYRIIGVKVTPPERGTPETAELFLEAL